MIQGRQARKSLLTERPFPQLLELEKVPVTRGRIGHYAETLSGLLGQPVDPEDLSGESLRQITEALRKQLPSLYGSDPERAYQAEEQIRELEVGETMPWPTETVEKYRRRGGVRFGQVGQPTTRAQQERDEAILRGRERAAKRADPILSDDKAKWAVSVLRNYAQMFPDGIPENKIEAFHAANAFFNEWADKYPEQVKKYAAVDQWRKTVKTLETLAPGRKAADISSVDEAMLLFNQRAKDPAALRALRYTAQRTAFSPLRWLESREYNDAVGNIQEGEGSYDDWMTVAATLDEAQRSEDRGFARQVFDTVAELPGYMAEFYATGGLAAVGRRGVVKGAALLAPRLAATRIGRIGVGITSRAVGVGARTLGMPHRIAEGIAIAQTPEVGLQQTAEGRIELWIEPNETSFLKALLEGYGRTYIAVLSEGLGEELPLVKKVLGKAAGKIPGVSRITGLKEPLGRLIKKIPAASRIKGLKGAIVNRLLQRKSLAEVAEIYGKAQWHGLLPEVFEERAEEVALGLTGLEKGYGATGALLRNDREGWNQLLVEAVAFSAPGAAQAAIAASSRIVQGKAPSRKQVETLGGLPEGQPDTEANRRKWWEQNETSVEQLAAIARARQAQRERKEKERAKPDEEAAPPDAGRGEGIRQRRREPEEVPRPEEEVPPEEEAPEGEVPVGEVPEEEAPPPKPKTPAEMTVAEIDAELAKEETAYNENLLEILGTQKKVETFKRIQRALFDPAVSERKRQLAVNQIRKFEQARPEKAAALANLAGRGEYVHELQEAREEARKRPLRKRLPVPAPTPVKPAVRPSATERMRVGAIVDIPTAGINVDPSRFQFKMGVTRKGVVKGEELAGEWEPVAGGVILIWEDKDGKRWVVNGHHRVDLAQRRGVPTLSGRIVREADGITEDAARVMGAELNILEGQGSIEDYAQFFRETSIAEEDARQKGLLARTKGQTGFLVGRFASEDVWAAYRGNKISADKAAVIADIGRGDEGLQAAGLSQAQKGKTADEIGHFLKVLKDYPRERGEGVTQKDLFGFDETALLEAEKLSKAVAAIIAEKKEHLLAVKGALKRPEKAREMGLSGDFESIQAEVDKIAEEVDEWSRWTTNPELVRQAREHAGLSVTPPAGGVGAAVDAQVMPEGAEPGAAEYERRAAGMEIPEPDAKRRRIEAQPIPLPEMVQLIQTLMGDVPAVKKLHRWLGLFKEERGGARAQIIINALAAKDPKLLAKVLAHEAGHLIDWFPQRSMTKGNVLGRIGSLMKYLKHWLGAEPGAPGPLTAEDRRRLRREAKRAAKEGAWVDIEEEIVERFDITPEDIINIWNSLEANVPADLLSYVKRLSQAEKFSLVKEALAGQVPEEVQRFAKEVRRKTGKVFKKFVEGKAGPEDIRAKYVELLRKEAEKRQLLSLEVIREELIRLTEWWTPFDRRTSSRRYVQYRQSARELYAEALSVLINSPHEVAKRAPEFYRGFSGWLANKPEFLNAYFDLQEQLNGGADNLSEIRENIRHSMYLEAEQKMAAAEAARRAAGLNPLKRIPSLLSQLFLHRGAPLKARAKKVSSDEALAAYYAMDELSYTESRNLKTFAKIKKAVADPLFAQGVTENEIGDYLFLHRVIDERNEIANPLGYVPEEAARELDYLRRRIGDRKFNLLEEKMQRWHDVFFESVEAAVEEGVYNREMFENTIKPNKDNYATFAVIKYLEDYIGPGLYKQIGTFRGIANPWDGSNMKVLSLNRLIELNRAKNRVRDFLRKHIPEEISRAEVSYRTGRPVKRPKLGFDHLLILENGKRVFYEVPQEIAAGFKRHDIGQLNRVMNLVQSATYQVFHPLFVTFSPGFIAANPFRDITRTWKNLGALGTAWNRELRQDLMAKGMTKEEAKEAAAPMKITLGQVLKSWFQARKQARELVSGEAGELVLEMFGSRALGSPFVEIAAVTGEVTKTGRLMQQFGIKEPTRKQQTWCLAQIGKVLQWIRKEGATQEYASKIAAWKLITERALKAQELGVDLISEPEKSHVVRRYTGTPDFKQRGSATSLTNGIMMYSNVKWQGLLAAYEVATDPRTRGGWWWRTMLKDVLPTSLKKAAMYGAFGSAAAAVVGAIGSGDDEEELDPLGLVKKMRRVSSYFLDNYHVIPLGDVHDPSGKEHKAKTLFMTVPKDDEGKVVSKIWGACLDFAYGKLGGDKEELAPNQWSKLFGETKDAIVPSWSPPIDILSAWSQFFSGANPHDAFFQTDVVPRTEWEAGGWAATRKMLAWTESKFGVAGQITHILTAPLLGQYYSPDHETVLERTLRLPLGWHRFLRVSNRGVREKEWIEMEMEDQEAARFKLGLPEEARYVVREYFRARRLDETKLSKDRRAEIRLYKSWYHSRYRKITAEMKAARTEKQREVLRKRLEKSAKQVLAGQWGPPLKLSGLRATKPTKPSF